MKKACAAEHKVTAEQLEKFAADKFVTENEDIKCFTKCMLNKSGSLSDNGVDIEKVVEFAVLKKKDAVKVSWSILFFNVILFKKNVISQARENAEKCKELFTGKNDCETAVSLIACFKKDE